MGIAVSSTNIRIPGVGTRGLESQRSGAFSPLSISGLVGWWDFSDRLSLWTDAARSTQVVNDTDPIGGVTDKSGTGRHISQSVAAQRPLYAAAAVNGKSTARFTIANSKQLLTAAGQTIAQPFTVVAIVKLATAFSGLAADKEVQAALDDIPQLGGHFATNKWYIYGGTALNSTVSSITTAAQCVQQIYNGASSNIRVDGTDTTGNAGATGYSADTIVLNQSVMDLDWCEMFIVSNAVSAGTLTSVDAYSRAKWGSA